MYNYLDILLAYTPVLYQGYIVSTLLNLLCSEKIGQKRAEVQNLIGIFLAVGLSLYYLVLLIEFVFSWYSGPEYNIYVLRGADSHKTISLFILLIPLVTLMMNSTKALRINYVVMFLSSLMFFPRLYEFFLILMTSPGITLRTINHVYLDPLINMFFYGVGIYVVSILIAKGKGLVPAP